MRIEKQMKHIIEKTKGENVGAVNRNSRKKVFFMVAVIVLVTGFPYLQKGLCGYFPDLMYHMLRIEAVKDSLLEGTFPVRVYENFFQGYGYGSPMFYPDIFLVFPACLRILNIPPLLVWKIFALCLAAAASVTSYLSIKYICKDTDFSIAATFLLLLSQFYLADLCHRVGLSEYLAFLFIPVLIAGIYDFFLYEGKKTWMLGVGLAGLVLSHTIMTFIGLGITLVIFVRMLFVPKSKNFLFDKRRMLRLIVTAVCTLLSVAYFIFPMLEQMVSGKFQYMTPWAKVGDYVQPFSTLFRVTGYFSHIAYVGVGIPILILAVICLLLKKPGNKWSLVFFAGGGFLFLAATPLFPWEKLNDSIFNMIQFPYRFYPYALLFLILGITMILVRNFKPGTRGRNAVLLTVIICAVFAGIVQNVTIKSSEESKQIDAQFLKTNSGYVGAGEWLPLGISPEVVGMTADGMVGAEGAKQELVHEGQYYYFKADGKSSVYTVPLMYYKGYEAWLYCEDGTKVQLPVAKSEDALVSVANIAREAGEICIQYDGTALQKVSSLVSGLTVFGILLYGIISRVQRNRADKTRNRENGRYRRNS